MKGGPPAGKVAELLRASGKRINQMAHQTMKAHLDAHPDANPWHIRFAVGLIWGHLAKNELEFSGHISEVLELWNDDDLAAARPYFIERGPAPIEQSLIGAHMLFEKVKLPPELPISLKKLGIAQERWLSPILNPISRPKYIGS